ncbi:MAG: CotH kinase family protein [Bacteroidaceae bacterium]
MIKPKFLFAITLMGLFSLGILSSCNDSDKTEETSTEVDDDTTTDSDEVTDEDETYDDWAEATHTKDVDPNFDEVFDDASVMRMDIVMNDTDWNTMQDNLATVLGSASSSAPMGGAPMGGGQGGQGGQTASSTGYVQNTSFDDPDWYSCSVFYNDIEWYHVGVRYKGNSSLQKAYQQGSNKLSFKFSFDKFEDDYPLLKNQRFYGFKQLNLNNNYMDESCMREKVAADLFRSFGMVAPHTRFCVVYVNHGSGAEYYGIYTLVEEVDDTVIDEYDDNDGNLYKPEGDAASFGINTYEESEFVKKTNEDDADYSDVLALYSVLHEDTRTTAPEEWKASLEKVLDVPVFLKWLAANTVMENWDTYGNMTHNYYLYNDPTTGLLNWIPWDNNESLQDDNRAISLDVTTVSDLWPLINFLMADADYLATYKADVQSFVTDCYNSTKMDTLYDTYSSLLQTYAAQENNSSFSSAVSTLKQNVSNRETAVSTYLSE